MVSLLLPVIYLAFISLGLPDGLLGAAWPTVYEDFGVPVSFAGVITFIICVGTITSSLFSDRLTRRFGTGKVTFFSVLLTAVAIFGFSFSKSFLLLCLWSVPYGLGAGGVDASLNNYVAVNYESHHMSWLHCMWGIGATAGPYIMGYALSRGSWPLGYRIVGIIQAVLTVILLLSLPIWDKKQGEKEISVEEHANDTYSLKFRDILKIPGAKEIFIMFFCYCAIEQTTGLWASSYLNMYLGVDTRTAANFASLFFLGITLGRGLNGFLTFKFKDKQLIRIGEILILVGGLLILFKINLPTVFAGIIIVGLGCAPIYPSIIHSTPDHFGADKSQAVIGVQMASAYVGSLLMPPLFGLIGKNISMGILPVYILVILVLMITMHEILCKKTQNKV